MNRHTSIQRQLFVAALSLAFLAVARPQAARAQDDAPVYARDAARTTKIEMIREEFREKQKELREIQERARSRKKGNKVTDRLPGSLESPLPRLPLRDTGAFGSLSTLVTPANVIANNRTGDGAGSGQCEQAIAFFGQYGLAAWNDGQGFINTALDNQGYAYTVDGGATWTDGGGPPRIAAITKWTSDPVVVVNDKTGEFWYCGLFSGPTSTNGVGVVRGTFSGSTFTWDTPRVVASGSNSSFAYDKQWMAVDSLSNNLYVSYTLFIVGGSNIQFQRSTNAGVSWSAAAAMNLASASGLVQGSRPVVGPSGEVYVTWYEIGPVDADFAKIRKSVDNGVSFTPEVTAATWFTNFGTGGPGFNRERGINMPSIAVDRSTGPNRGRVYIAYNETFNWYDDALGGGGNQNELEPNGFFAGATSFTAGQRLRGAFTTTGDVDYFKWNANAGQNYVFWVDSIPTPLYTLRVRCGADTSTLLSLTGDLTSPAGGNGFIVFTAPTTATYYLRMQHSSGGSAANRGYRIQTGLGVPNDAIHGRDANDAMLVYSNNGTTWTGPVRMNDSNALFYEWLPEVAVGCDGSVYSMWYDWRDALTWCGGRSHIYGSRSTNGGAAWAANQVVSTAQTAWTSVSSNIAPNQGDYNGIFGGAVLGMAWGDGRLGDPDVFTAKVPLGYTLTGCPANATVTASTTFPVNVTIGNLNTMYGNDYSWTLTTSTSWPGTPATGTVSAIEGGSAIVSTSIAIPDSAAHLEVVHCCLTVSFAGGACAQTCCFDLTVENFVTATQASLASATADAGTVRLRWLLEGASSAEVERSSDGASWTTVGQSNVDGEGFLSYTDTAVEPGQRYAYRLAFLSDGRMVRGGQAWVSVPANLTFALQGVRPNPATSGFSVAFALPTGAPATIEVLDLAGRRVLSREVGSLGAGSHTVSLARETATLHAGIYLVRLSQAGRVANTRVTVVR